MPGSSSCSRTCCATGPTSPSPFPCDPQADAEACLNEIEPFARWLRRWALVPDGDPWITQTSRLLPVRWQGAPAMLKIATIAEEARGARQLAWWAGNGSAHVLRIEDEAVLIERAPGGSLVEMSRAGDDDEATRIICAVARRLHTAADPPGFLVPLDEWFRPLLEATADAGSEIVLAAATARHLLQTSVEPVPLHGDLHHWNVLDFGGGDWRAIDPKGLVGERAFEFIHLLRNPDCRIALAPGRLARRVSLVAHEAILSRRRLLDWTIAFAGLSAAWFGEEGDLATAHLDLLRIAAGLSAEIASEP